MDQRSLLLVLLILSTSTLTRCGLLEMSQTLWTKLVTGGLTKIGKLDPLRVPLIKVDQSEGDTSYRIILRNLEILGLNESTLESVHVARGGLKSNLSELEAGYVSYSDLRDVESVRYRFHTMMKQLNAPKESLEAVVSPSSRAAEVRASSRYQENRGRTGNLQQNQQGFSAFEQRPQYDRQATFFRPVPDGPRDKGQPRTSGDSETSPGSFASPRRPVYVQPVYSRETAGFQEDHRASFSTGGEEDAVDCVDTRGGAQYRRVQSGDADGRYRQRIADDAEVHSHKLYSESRVSSQSDRIRFSNDRASRNSSGGIYHLCNIACAIA